MACSTGPGRLRPSVPAVAGALVGAWLALDVDDRAFRRILAALMVPVTLWTLIDPLDKRPAASSSARPGRPASPPASS